VQDHQKLFLQTTASVSKVETNLSDEIPARFDRPSFDSWIDSLESSDKSILDNAADSYDRWPSVIRALKNFDHSGFVGYVADVLMDNKAKRNEMQLREVLYHLCLAIYELERKINTTKLEIDRIKPQMPILSDVYLDTGMRSYQIEKIEYLKNILVNSIIDYDRELDEKISIFNLLDSLTISQIRAAIFVNVNYRIMKLEEIAHELGVENAYARQICMSLNGMGLLNITDIGGWGQRSGGNEFGPTEYGKQFVAYVVES